MAQSNVNMSKLKRSFQMLAAKIPQRTICEQLHMGRGVLNRYKTLADSQGLSYGVIGRMSDGEIESFLQLSKPTAAPSSQRQVLDGLLPEYVSDLSHNRYLTIQALHESYKKEHPDGYGYTQFKKSIREYQYSHNLSFHNTYIPGEEMQIDFAGDALWLTDPKTGELTKVVVLVCILPYSGLGFAKAMYNASMENFFGGISDAFSYFGGTTRIAKSDNMQQWVKKYDRYEPTFNGAFHKGAIKTGRCSENRGVARNFNSIKVRLEQQRQSSMYFCSRFQFHKGAIRTLSAATQGSTTLISIP